DGHVTGVQTCALPICHRTGSMASHIQPTFPSQYDQRRTTRSGALRQPVKGGERGAHVRLGSAATQNAQRPAVTRSSSTQSVVLRSEERRVEKECRSGR